MSLLDVIEGKICLIKHFYQLSLIENREYTTLFVKRCPNWLLPNYWCPFPPLVILPSNRGPVSFVGKTGLIKCKYCLVLQYIDLPRVLDSITTKSLLLFETQRVTIAECDGIMMVCRTLSVRCSRRVFSQRISDLIREVSLCVDNDLKTNSARYRALRQCRGVVMNALRHVSKYESTQVWHLRGHWTTEILIIL